jgi:CheY-like chemotaxis protein
VVTTIQKVEDYCQLQFEVIDNGIGISKEDHDKIFEEFVQIERREDDYQGTGLGLPIVKKLVELFGGEIFLESEEDKGTKISFVLNLEYNDELQIVPEVLETAYDLKGEDLRILLVEDNKINQIVTERILSNFGFETIIVESGQEAIAQLTTQDFDIVLMDINMPQMNGFETTRLIREKQLDIPVIALTAFDKQEINDDIINSGMNGVMIKPFEPVVLYKMIMEIISTHKKENLSTKSS